MVTPILEEKQLECLITTDHTTGKAIKQLFKQKQPTSRVHTFKLGGPQTHRSTLIHKFIPCESFRNLRNSETFPQVTSGIKENVYIKIQC
jgi:hypothetical protein